MNEDCEHNWEYIAEYASNKGNAFVFYCKKCLEISKKLK